MSVYLQLFWQYEVMSLLKEIGAVDQNFSTKRNFCKPG